MTETLINKRKAFKILPLFIFLVVCSFFQAKVSIPGIIISENRIEVSPPMAHDGFWHVSLIDRIKEKIPPEQPGFVGENLSNYHYFLDILMSFLSKITGVSSLYLYFNLFPFGLAFFYGASGFLVFKKLTKNYYWSLLGTFLLYFSNNLAFLLPFFREGDWGENSFMLNQPIAFSQNLALLSSLVLLFLFILNFKRKILASFILGITFGIKAHTALPLFLGLLSAGLLDLLLYKRNQILKVVIVVSVISGAVLFWISRPFGNLIFIPGWILSQMIADPDRLNFRGLALKDNNLRQSKISFRLLHLQIELFFIYLLGNLGIRILGFYEGIREIIRKKFSPLKFFLVVSGFTSLLIPVFFNQRRSVYDIVQFGELGIVIFTILTVIFLQRKLQPYGLKKRIVIVSFILILTLPTSLKMIHGYLNQGFSLIGGFEKEGLDYLKNKVSAEAVILVYPSQRNLGSHYIEALSGKKVFYADRKTAMITGKNYQEREEEVKSFFGLVEDKPNCEFLKRYNISYLFLQKEEGREIKCPVRLEEIFKNPEVKIYRFLD